MESCIYEGRVVHRRYHPLKHHFLYSVYMVYLDLDELPELWRRGGLGRTGWAPLAFRESDHLSDIKVGGTEEQGPSTLRDRVVQLVQHQTGLQLTGPIRLLTQLRCFGYYFSPLNLFYCFDATGRQLEAIVAEVSNTPWEERHNYVLWSGNRTLPAPALSFRCEKVFHVSPFMGMAMRYHWRLTPPGTKLGVRIENRERDERLFDAVLSLTRRSWSTGRLRATLACYPWMTGKIFAGIYWQALQLWWKKCPYYPHPKSASPKPAP